MPVNQTMDCDKV